MKVTYYIEDGYAGKRPQTFDVDPADFDGMNDQQIEDELFEQAERARNELPVNLDAAKVVAAIRAVAKS